MPMVMFFIRQIVCCKTNVDVGSQQTMSQQDKIGTAQLSLQGLKQSDLTDGRGLKIKTEREGTGSQESRRKG